MNPVETLRAAADNLDQLAAAAEWEAWRGAQDHADMAWIEAMSPQVAPSLSAWLRAEAACIESVAFLQETAPRYAEALEEQLTGKPSPGWRLNVKVSSTDEALAFARMVLGESTGDPS